MSGGSQAPLPPPPQKKNIFIKMGGLPRVCGDCDHTGTVHARINNTIVLSKNPM